MPLVPLLLLVPDSAPTASGRRESVVQPALLQLASDGKRVWLKAALQAAFSVRLWVCLRPRLILRHRLCLCSGTLFPLVVFLGQNLIRAALVFFNFNRDKQILWPLAQGMLALLFDIVLTFLVISYLFHCIPVV